MYSIRVRAARSVAFTTSEKPFRNIRLHQPGEGKIEWDGNNADIQAQNLQGAHLKDSVQVASRSHAIGQLLDTLWTGKVRAVSEPSEIDVAGHRVVHGGQELKEATCITPAVKAAIAHMSAFAPLHNRAEMEGIEIIEQRMGNVLQVAVCSTQVFTADCRMRRPYIQFSRPYATTSRNPAPRNTKI